MAEKEQGASQAVSLARSEVSVKKDASAVGGAKTPAAESAVKKEEPSAKAPAASSEKKEEKKVEKKAEPVVREVVLERVYNVPLVEAYKKTHYKRADFALNLLREFAARHMSAEKENVRISTAINEAIRARGSRRPLKMVKVRLTKDKQGRVLVEALA